MSFLATQLIGFGAGDESFSPYSTDYAGGSVGASGNTSVAVTVSVPAGATAVIIECIGGGAGNLNYKGAVRAGGGGAYSKKTISSLVGYTAIYVSPGAAGSPEWDGAASLAKQNTSGGTLLCDAKGSSGRVGGGSATGTGDTKYSGGSGGNSAGLGGGGAAGPSGVGGDNSGATGGTSGGSPAGAGGNSATNGSNYGGGAGAGSGNSGGTGLVRLSWS